MGKEKEQHLTPDFSSFGIGMLRGGLKIGEDEGKEMLGWITGSGWKLRQVEDSWD